MLSIKRKAKCNNDSRYITFLPHHQPFANTKYFTYSLTLRTKLVTTKEHKTKKTIIYRRIFSLLVRKIL